MSLPPKDIPASQLWLKLQELPRPFKLVDFPRRGPDGEPVGQLAIRILTQEEQMACAATAEDFTKKLLKEQGRKDELGYERVFTDSMIVETLYRACRDPADVTRPAFPTAVDIRRTLTTEECAKLFEHYMTVQLELGPTVISMTDGELDAWIDRLAEGGSSFPFDLLSSDLQKIVLLHMAYQLRSSPTDTSSVGSQPEEPQPNDSKRLEESPASE